MMILPSSESSALVASQMPWRDSASAFPGTQEQFLVSEIDPTEPFLLDLQSLRSLVISATAKTEDAKILDEQLFMCEDFSWASVRLF